MNKTKLTTKLAAAEASLKRWQTKLKRAATMVHQLDKARRRYQLELLSANQPQEVVAVVKVKKGRVVAVEPPKPQIETDHLSEAEFTDFVKRGQAAQAAVDKLTKKEKGIPAFLDRSDPLIAEKMTAARKKAEAAERKKMPLTGKAASDYIKAKK